MTTTTTHPVGESCTTPNYPQDACQDCQQHELASHFNRECVCAACTHTLDAYTDIDTTVHDTLPF